MKNEEKKNNNLNLRKILDRKSATQYENSILFEGNYGFG